ncbi:MAG: three-Cys-motif partner protein TcmP, partial [Thioalkalivibrio sp.]|nr:three-Cys-motif partner protein TcmP [Thioalkalivibrio sp.]
MAKQSAYEGREQTLVKHVILRQYLSAWAHKVGSFCDTLTYVDCFSGPWNAVSDDLGDASFCIALEELRKARDTFASSGRKIQIRCLFIEKTDAAYARLNAFGESVDDADIATIQGEFENHVPDVIAFIKAGGRRSFPFVFIDPTGWTGFAMDTIEPLLQLNPIEVLINFMTSHIRRFVESPQEETRESFTRMFGSADYADRVQGTTRLEKEDALIGEYFRNLKARGGFEHVAAAMVLDPDISRTAFHLIYATRNIVGLQVFKTVEKSAMSTMLAAQESAALRKRQAEKAQGDLFGPIEMIVPKHYEMLRARYIRKARALVTALLSSKTSISYDVAWRAALSFPLVWESDLKEWIRAWRRDGSVIVNGLGPREQVPKLDHRHTLTFVPPEN